jgi:DNA (cytosine-5)-methyltransferase 1
MRSHMRYASVCDGIGAAHVAWQPLGWECAWTSEIEPFPAAVVDHHWKLKNLGDMTKLTEEMLNEQGPIDLLVGGTPCQSFSVAGLRGGLADPRGNLALRFVQLVGVLRPEWVVWENVPGVLSSAGGRDFGTFLGALAELGYGFAYRVLDAQWFGVAQRRRRVFVVAHARDWRRAAAVLFERESLLGNPPTRGKAGQEVTRAAVSSSARKGGASNVDANAGQLILSNDPAHAICHNEQPTYTNEGNVFQLRNVVAQGLACGQACDEVESLVPFAAPIQYAEQLGREKRQNGMGLGDNGDPMFTLETRQPHGVATGFTFSGYSNQPAWMTGDRTDCLPASGHSDGSHQGVGVVCGDDDTIGTIRSNTRNNSDPVTEAAMHVMHGMAVRRLTPKECERLQGFPDGYTDVTYRNKPAADGPRYRALGNSMAVPVMAWIGKRIQVMEEATDGR